MGVYLTTNGGATWRQTLKDDLITSVEFSKSDPRIAYAASEFAVYRSADTGRTWSRMTSVWGWGPVGVRAGYPIDLQLDPRNPNRLFANNYGGGNFLSTNGGRTWTVASQGYTGAQVRVLAVDPNHSARAYVGGRSGPFQTADGGSSWKGVGRSPANMGEFNAVAIDPASGSHLVAGTHHDGSVFASYDGGVSWRVTTRVGQGVGLRVVTFAPSDSRRVYAGTARGGGVFLIDRPAEGVLVSEDGGLTWRKAAGAFSKASIAALAVDPREATRVFAASTNYGVLKSVDGARTWSRLGGGLPSSLPALTVAIDPAHADILLAGFEGGSVYRSSDGGASWKQASTGLDPEAAVSSVVFSPVDSSVTYAADRRTGVYRSTDGGIAWTPLNEGLQCRAVNALAPSGDGQHLYAGTEGGGVYRLDLSGLPPAKYQVPPPASLSRPQPSRITMPYSAPLAVSGSVRPGHATAGTLTCEKLIGGRWTKAGAYARTWISSVGGAFRVSYRLPAGKYRFRSSHGSTASTGCHLPSTSTVSATVTVR